jgi:hypothetical protein
MTVEPPGPGVRIPQERYPHSDPSTACPSPGSHPLAPGLARVGRGDAPLTLVLKSVPATPPPVLHRPSPRPGLDHSRETGLCPLPPASVSTQQMEGVLKHNSVMTLPQVPCSPGTVPAPVALPGPSRTPGPSAQLPPGLVTCSASSGSFSAQRTLPVLLARPFPGSFRSQPKLTHFLLKLQSLDSAMRSTALSRPRELWVPLSVRVPYQ